MKTLKLRDYQDEAISAIRSALALGMKRPAVVLPTGMGKTVIFSELIRLVLGRAYRVGILVDRDELAVQTLAKIHDAAPGADVGVVKAGRNEINHDVVIMSVQTVRRTPRLHAFPADHFDLIIVDECDLAAAEGYHRILHYFGCFDPEAPTRAVGFTATMDRTDDRHLGDTWQRVVYTKDILWAIEHGYLVNPVGQQVRIDGLDVDTLRRTAGDFQDMDLATQLAESGATHQVAQAYRQYGSRPDGTLRPGGVFAPTVTSAEEFAEAFIDVGIRAATVVGTTPIEERKLIYKAIKHGDLDVICSCSVLTRGFDLPELEVGVIARMTMSAPLYTQMVGRFLRPAPWAGKKDALILDVVGATERHSIANMSVLTRSKVDGIQDGETLTEAVTRTKNAVEAEEAPERKQHRASETKIVDLFDRSRSAWLQTTGGIWFIPTRECVVFLWESTDGGTYRIGRSHNAYQMKGGNGHWLLDGQEFSSIDMAMPWAEQEAADLDPSVSSRKASWRRKPANDKQIAFLTKLGVVPDPDMKSGEVSDQTSVIITSRMLDRR